MFAKKLENVLDNTILNTVDNEGYFLFNNLLESYSYNSHTNSLLKTDFIKHEQPNQIREALIKGYVEMSHINLTICLECQYAEYEAQHTTERLVSGG